MRCTFRCSRCSFASLIHLQLVSPKHRMWPVAGKQQQLHNTCGSNVHKGAADSSGDSSRQPAAKALPTSLELTAYSRHGRVWIQAPQGKATRTAVAKLLRNVALHDAASDRFCRDVEGHVGCQGNTGWRKAHCHQALQNGPSINLHQCNQ